MSDDVIGCQTFVSDAFDDGRFSKKYVVSELQVPIDPS